MQIRRKIAEFLYPKKVRKTLFDFKIQNKWKIILILIAIGILLRFIVMSFGHNFDFDSYKIVGGISGDFHNVYANTARYNYGPIFSCIQGLLYNLSHISLDWEATYRVLIVSVLTMFDLGIALFIAKKYSVKKALIFFLNPVSIIITGYHNQFDNIAIFFALISTLFYNEDKKFTKRDLLFILFMSISIITKHIFAIFMLFILLKKGLPRTKRFAYAFIPPIMFLLSFLPFAFSSPAALDGIIHNVFLYKSFNNFPLISDVLNWIGLPKSLYMVIFAALMGVVAVLCRKQTFSKSMFIYMIALVTFSSAIANQYLVIPLAALCILDTGVLKYIYMALTGWFLVSSPAGLHLPITLKAQNNNGLFYHLSANFSTHRVYTILVWVLFITLVYELVLKNQRIKKKILNYLRRQNEK